MQSLTGHFLVSMPKLLGSVFGDAVIYLWAHDDQGAQGLVINHAHDLTLVKLFDQLDLPFQATVDAPVVDGGPVEPQRGIILHTDDVAVESSEAAGEGLAISYSREILERIATQQGPRQYLVALGYAGWGAGQLEHELEDSAWLIAPGCREVLFEVPLALRLDRVAGDLGIDLRLLGVDAGHA